MKMDFKKVSIFKIEAFFAFTILSLIYFIRIEIQKILLEGSANEYFYSFI